MSNSDFIIAVNLILIYVYCARHLIQTFGDQEILFYFRDVQNIKCESSVEIRGVHLIYLGRYHLLKKKGLPGSLLRTPHLWVRFHTENKASTHDGVNYRV